MRDVPAAVVAIAIAIAGAAVAAVRAAVQAVVREVMVVAAPAAAVADAEDGSSSSEFPVMRRAAAMRPFPFGVAECGFTVAVSRSWSDGRPRPSKRAQFARSLSTRDPGIKPW